MTLSDIIRKGRKILNDTALEVVIGAIVGVTTLGYIGHTFETNREELIKIQFPEMSQIRDKYEDLPAHQDYYMELQAFVMKVFESWNDACANAMSDTNKYENFSNNLNHRLRFHPYRNNIADLLEELPETINKFKIEIDPHIKGEQILSRAVRALDDVWDYRSKDNYHSEMRTRTVTSTDANGNTSTSTETYWEDVYDDTDHYFTFDRKKALTATQFLLALQEQYGQVTYDVTFRTAQTIQAENLRAIRESRNLDEDELTQEQALRIADIWLVGNNLFRERGVFNTPFSWTDTATQEMEQVALNGQTIHYNTKRTKHPGPQEYQTAEKVLSLARTTDNSLNSVIRGIYFTENNLPKLHQLIYTFAHPKHDDSDKEKSEEIIRSVKELYARNFAGAPEIEEYRLGMVLLYGMLGCIAGAAMGVGVDRLTTRYNLWESRPLGQKEVLKSVTDGLRKTINVNKNTGWS